MAILVKEGFVSVGGSTVPLFNYDQLDQLSNVSLRNRQLDLKKVLDLAKLQYLQAPAHKAQRIKWILDMQDMLKKAAGSPQPTNLQVNGMQQAGDLKRERRNPMAEDPPEELPGPRRTSPYGEQPAGRDRANLGPPAMQPPAGPRRTSPYREEPAGRNRANLGPTAMESPDARAGPPLREGPAGRARFSPITMEIPDAPVGPSWTSPKEEPGGRNRPNAAGVGGFRPFATPFEADGMNAPPRPAGMSPQQKRATMPAKPNFHKVTEWELDSFAPNRLHQKCVEITDLLERDGRPYPSCPKSRTLKIKWLVDMQNRLAEGLGQSQAFPAGNPMERFNPMAGTSMAQRNTQMKFEPPPRQSGTTSGTEEMPWFDIPEMPASGELAGASSRMRRRNAPTLQNPGSNLKGVRRQSLLSKKSGDPRAHYDQVSRLGEGSFGVTELVKHKTHGHERCLKTVNKVKAQVPPELMEQEFQALALIDHPHVIKLFEYWEDNNNCYFVTEAYKGGTLLDVIEEHRKARQPINEGWLAEVFQQVLEGIAYCHKRNLIHKDLKSENIMLLEKETQANPYGVHAVIIDLGLSECFSLEGNAHEIAGTPITMAPELWRASMGAGSFGTKCDIYSIGCVLFRMLSSSGIPPVVPTGGGQPQDWLQAIRRGPNWNLIKKASAEVKDLVKSMLAYDEDKRPDALTALKHPWFAKARADTADVGLRTVHYQALLSHRQQHRSPFQKNVLMKVASQMGADELRDVNAVFRRYDQDHSGSLTVDEVVSLLKDLGVSEEAAVEAANGFDVSQDGMVDYTEFVTACISHRKASLREHLREAFDQFDVDNDGVLSREEVRRVLNCDDMPDELCNSNEADVDAILEELEFDRLGSISFDEFAELFIPSN